MARPRKNPRVTKACVVCGEVREHYTRAGWSKRRQRMTYTPEHGCVGCVRERLRAWTEKNKDRLHKSCAKYNRSKKGLARSRNRDPEKRAACARRYRERYPERVRAKGAVRRALNEGRLARPPRCQACGGKPTPHGSNRYGLVAHHHAGYDEANWLNVTWLCVPCHRRGHGAYKHMGPAPENWVEWGSRRARKRERFLAAAPEARRRIAEDRQRLRAEADACRVEWERKKVEANRG
jgi:hypothetical protein